MTSPLFVITWRILSGMVATRSEHSWGSVEFQISSILLRSSSVLVAGFCCNFLFILNHKDSIGDKSGLLEGHCIVGILCAVNQSFVLLAVWEEAPSCWKMNSPFGDSNKGIEGKSSVSRRFWYFTALIVPLIKKSLPTPLADMHPQIMTEVGNLDFLRKHSGRNASFFWRMTFLPVSPNGSSKRDSSLQIIDSHCLAVHCMCSFANFNRSFFCLCVRYGFSFG